MVIIVMLAYQLEVQKAIESSFVLDFSKQEELEKQEKEIAFKDEISKQLDELLDNSAPKSSSYRNLAVDRSVLKDDRNTDADQLYKDAARLQAELENGSRAAQYEEKTDDAVDLDKNKSTGAEKQGAEYSGPSIVSYDLNGRKAHILPTPAYRCMGSGRVTVVIAVGQDGRVLDAQVLESQSSSDMCLKKYAIRAARGAKFAASTTAPKKDMGSIVYEFIAQ